MACETSAIRVKQLELSYAGLQACVGEFELFDTYDKVSQLLHEIGHLLYEAGQLLYEVGQQTAIMGCGRLGQRPGNEALI